MGKVRYFRHTFIGGLLLLSLMTACGSPQNSPAESAGTVLYPPRQLQDFTLTNQAGKPMKLSDLRGQIALVFFGYTNCPDVCPIVVSNFTQIKAALGDKASKVAFVFISVDGKHDTPEVLTRWLGAFDPTFIGLTG